MKRLYLFLFVILSGLASPAQDFENYRTMLSKGAMPEDFKLMGSEKYRKELENIREKGNTSDSKHERNFALESNFAITDMMMSGRVIYGDEPAAYVNKIADLLLRDNKSLRDELRFYTIKSTTANAYSTNQGIIFITTGLIAQVENEAQLAFVIAHEIIHYTEKHNYEQFKKREVILASAGRSSTTTIEDKLKSLYKYSKNNESEADKKGMQLFLKTNYNPYSAIGLMDVLLYSYLPYDMIEWNPRIFETEYYKFPEDYISADLDDISAEEDDDDDNQTHPNIAKRKSNLNDLLEKDNIDSVGKSLYLVSQTEFIKIQKLARFESASLYIKAGNPVKAYYIAFLLDNTYGANTYTDKIKATSIYSLAHHLHYGDELNDYGCNTKKYEGDVQQLPRFFNKLKKNEFSVFAAKYLWEIGSKYPKDQQIKIMRDQVFREMFENKSVAKAGFINYAKVSDTTKTGNSKVDKIKGKKKSSKYDKYYYGAFYTLLKDKKFESYFNDISRGDQNDEEDEDEDNDIEPRKGFKKQDKGSDAKDKIKQIVLFLPDFNSSGNNTYNPIRDESRQQEIESYYHGEASRLGIKLFIIDKADKDNFDTEAFNNFSLMNDWLIERINNDTLTMELYQKEFIDDIFKDYDTRYLGWTGFNYNNSKLESLMMLYDVETGKPVQVIYNYLRKKPRNLTIKGIIYIQLYKIKYGK